MVTIINPNLPCSLMVQHSTTYRLQKWVFIDKNEKMSKINCKPSPQMTQHAQWWRRARKLGNG
jgi:hypothetical protein